MRTGLSQHTSLRQELRVNPRLYQAMDMLYMPMMDLQQHLKQELLANPFLELLEPEDETTEQPAPEEQKEQKEKEEEVDWEEILLNGFEVGGTREQYEQLEYTEPVTVETRNLIDHLREQLQMLTLTPRQLLLAEEFLGNINEEGYLAASLEEILGSVNQLIAGHVHEERGGGEDEEGGAGDLDNFSMVQPGSSATAPAHATPTSGSTETSPSGPSSPPYYTMQEAEEMLAIVQRLDPSGTGARDLRECLLIQLTELADTQSLTYRLVSEAFSDLIAHRWNDLAKRFGVEPSAVQAAADGLGRLDPKPWLKHASQNDGYI
ncbi:MAG: hypothetical protein ICV68_18845, partial [Pyrinomonadaceae bacterium]|nr:hypothetical protein [Pyrinomonadaceae bacterium]